MTNQPDTTKPMTEERIKDLRMWANANLTTTKSEAIEMLDEIERLRKENQELREALKPFCPGTDPIPWGKIKAHLPTELARLLTSFNVRAEWASKLTTETKDAL